jgi:hypothetical protein
MSRGKVSLSHTLASDDDFIERRFSAILPLAQHGDKALLYCPIQEIMNRKDITDERDSL